MADEAIARYDADGLDAILAYHNNPNSVDAQWYVFIATPDCEILGHYNADDLGVHLEEMLDDGSFLLQYQDPTINALGTHNERMRVQRKSRYLFGKAIQQLVNGTESICRETS